MSLWDLPCGAGRAAIGPLPTGSAWEVLRAWQPDLVISVISGTELPTGFADRVAGATDHWKHVPIADFGTPGPEVESAMNDAVEAAVDWLSRGGRVFFHCKGGCGRSGMTLLKVMIEMGEPPDAALKRLRAIRPCAVETDAQLGWAIRQP